MTSRPIYGLVLAGGKSRRMGQDKALLKRHGQSQLEYAAGLLAECTDRVYVSARSDQADDPLRSQFDLIIDRYENLGPLAGILSAMESYPDADWLVIACDLPNISDVTLAALLAAPSGEEPFVAFTSTYDDLPEPLCAIYRSGSTAVLHKFVADGINCPRKIMIRSNTRLLAPLDPAALDNVNTPDDLDGSILQASN